MANRPPRVPGAARREIVRRLCDFGDSMPASPRICVVGSANVDLTFRTPRLPQPGETLAGSSFLLGMGGKGANQAVAAARLGATVSLVARVGNDAFGQEALRRYKMEGLGTSFVIVDSDRPTGIAAIVVDDNAENSIVVVAGANAGLSPNDVRAATSVIQNADLLLCQLETPLDATLEAFRLRAIRKRPDGVDAGPCRDIAHGTASTLRYLHPQRNRIAIADGTEH